MRDMRVAGLAIAMLLLGCGKASAAQPSALEQALERLDASLAAVAHIAPSDLLGDEKSARYRAAQATIRRKQCDSASANPLLLSLPTHVILKGRLRQGDVEIAGDAFDIPLHVAALGDLPGEYLRQAATNGASQEMAARRAELARDYATLDARVSAMIASFDPAACGGRVRARWPQAVVFMPPSF